jgi:hypothetical protein
MLIVLFVVLVGAGIAQVVIASGHRAPLPGPTSPRQLPTSSPTPSP